MELDLSQFKTYISGNSLAKWWHKEIPATGNLLYSNTFGGMDVSGTSLEFRTGMQTNIDATQSQIGTLNDAIPNANNPVNASRCYVHEIVEYPVEGEPEYTPSPPGGGADPGDPKNKFNYTTINASSIRLGGQISTNDIHSGQI